MRPAEFFDCATPLLLRLRELHLSLGTLAADTTGDTRDAVSRASEHVDQAYRLVGLAVERARDEGHLL